MIQAIQLHTTRFKKAGISFIEKSLKTWHDRFILLGLTVGLLYLPAFLPHLIVSAFKGGVSLWLISAAVALASGNLWMNRLKISKLEASEEDQVLGHLLIICSAILFPFCRFAIWPQSILWAMALAGIAISSWGILFFVRFPLPPILLAISIYPKPSTLARILWRALTPPDFLEKIMGQAGAGALRLIGQPAIAEGTFVAIPPSGAVDVQWACNGFDMAVTMAGAGLVMGLFLKQRWSGVLTIMILGAGLALIFNVPRIMLLAIASIHWGRESFKFWHGPWGGQIFTGVVFTVYYYAVMGYVKRRPSKQP